MSRYSQLYIRREQPNSDLARARHRVFSLFSGLFGNADEFRGTLYRLIGFRLGVAVTRGDWSAYFSKCEVRDFLDTITLVSDALSQDEHRRSYWIESTQEIFREENLAYRVGEDGIVRPLVDEEFDLNQSATLKALDQERFQEARDDFEKAIRHLRNSEGKQAIRMMFPAVEVAAKVLFPGRLSRLMANDIDAQLKPCIKRKYGANEPAHDAGMQLLESFKRWIVASQPYRHGQEVKEAIDPPQELVVLHLSTGAAFLRWMIELTE